MPIDLYNAIVSAAIDLQIIKVLQSEDTLKSALIYIKDDLYLYRYWNVNNLEIKAIFKKVSQDFELVDDDELVKIHKQLKKLYKVNK